VFVKLSAMKDLYCQWPTDLQFCWYCQKPCASVSERLHQLYHIPISALCSHH